MSSSPKTKKPLNTANPLAQYLEQFRDSDPPRWLYERARLRNSLGISRAHFQRMIDGYGCSLDVALQLHELTNGRIHAEQTCPAAPWDRLKAYFAPSNPQSK